MKRWLATAARTGVLLLLAVGMAVPALAATLTGRLSTVLEWYDDPEGDTAMPVHQYALVHARDLPGGWSFHGYGRVADDFADEVEVDSRLYNAYFRNTSLMRDLDLSLGRQFITTAAGGTVMDGVDARYRLMKSATLRVLGGWDVSFDEAYHSNDYVLGAELAASPLADLALSLGYLQLWDQGDLAQELLGFTADYDLAQRLHLYNETQYSWLYDQVTYLLFGASAPFGSDWRGRIEYLYSLPVFDSTSIYSVFAVAEYEEVMAELEYRINRDLRSYARYTREIYEEYQDADVFEAGLETTGTRNLSGYLAGVVRLDNDGQDLNGVKARLAYRLLPQFVAGVGAHVDVFERRLDETDDDMTTSSRVWVDGSYDFTRMVQLQAKVERVDSDLWDYYYSGRVRLNVRF